MAINWQQVKTRFSTLSPQDTVLVNGFNQEFVAAIEDFFNNNPKVKQFDYTINWRLDGGIRSVEKQSTLSPSSTNATGGRSAHNYGLAIDFAPVGLENNNNTGTYAIVTVDTPYAIRPIRVAEPWAVAIIELYNHPTLRSGATFLAGGSPDYGHIEWRNYRELARSIAPQYWSGVGNRTSTSVPTTRTTPSPALPPISPFIAANESFHPHIQYELTRRRNSAEMANVYMPYVKLTSLVKVYNANLPAGQPSGSFGAQFPSLGIHGQRIVDFDSVYNPQDGRSIVGTATDEQGRTVPVLVDANEDTNLTDPPNIPPPGIMSITAERSTAGGFGVRGGLLRANINIRAYSLGQMNALLKYFIRQGTRVVLEIGRASSSNTEQELTNSTELSLKTLYSDRDIPETRATQLFSKFNWNRPPAEITQELQPLVLLQRNQREFIEEYTYNNFGNYEIFLGYVATFKLKYTKDNVYDVELTVHSVQQFEVPTTLGGTRSSPSTQISTPNLCEPIDIMDYFRPESGFRNLSFKSVLASAATVGTEVNNNWGNHIIPLRSAGSNPGASGVSAPGYLVSWKFFVDVILNHPTLGLLGTFQLQRGIDQNTLSVLRASLLSEIGQITNGVNNNINANEVSWHPKLRSTDPNTMIIYNKTAQDASRQNDSTIVLSTLGSAGDIPQEDLQKIQSGINDSVVRQSIESNTVVGSFDEVGTRTSYLTNGVWLNTSAIIDAFTSADTITAAITRLLVSMNNATRGYWNLELLSAEPQVTGLYVIDSGLSKPVEVPLVPYEEDTEIGLPAESTSLIQRFKQDVNFFSNPDGTPKYLYVFNRKLRRLQNSDMGGELLNINYDASMPNVIAVQVIAGVGGIAQRGVLASIDVDELKNISIFDTYPGATETQQNTCSDSTFSALTDKNTNNTLTNNEVSSILGSVYKTGVTPETQETQIQESTKVIEEAAFERWKENNKLKIESGELTETEGRQLVRSDIQSIRNVPRDIYERGNPGYLDLVRQYATTYGRALDLIEYDSTRLSNDLDVGREEQEIHPFNISNLTKTVVDLTLPGIGGILLFQAFVVDRIPNILRRGYYIVTKITHEFSIENGWITKIQGRFRFKPNMQGEARL